MTLHPGHRTPVRSQLATLRLQLMLASVGVMTFTLIVGGTSVYQIISRNLYSQLDQDLFTLLEAAAHSLPDDHDEYDDPRAHERDFEDPHLYRDNDDDLDLPWQNLKQRHQGIEWFDRQAQLLYQVGEVAPPTPLNSNRYPQQVKGYRVITAPIYGSEASTAGELRDDELRGYVRVSGTTVDVVRELHHLKYALAWGGIAALGVSSLGSWWLMRLATRPVEQTFERLRQFTADASHELRSPLTAIKTSIEVIQSHPERIHPADVRKVDIIAKATRQMSHLVNDLLLLARLDNASLASAAVVIFLDDLLEELADSYTLQAAQQQLALSVRLTAAAAIRGNGSQLKRLFGNVIDNALKYTPAGGTITLTSQLQDRDVVITISDTGMGIDEAHLPHVYERFWRADPVRSHRDGSGLGLSIAQRLVEAHHGTISISSQLNQGTTVRVAFPVTQA